jgi:hypothetical protein
LLRWTVSWIYWNVCWLPSSLQAKVSEIHEESVRNSLSIWTALGDFFRGRSTTLLQCADDIMSFKNHIEVCLNCVVLNSRNSHCNRF